MLPTRGIIVGFSRNALGRTNEEARRISYAKTQDTENIIHIRQNCSGMINPRVHYITVEMADMFRWCGVCARYGEGVDMPSYCPCCDNMLCPQGVENIDMIRYARHVHSGLVDHQAPITRTSTCDEKFQRRVLIKAREFLQSSETLRMAGSTGRAILAGNWVARMLRKNPYWSHCF